MGPAAGHIKLLCIIGQTMMISVGLRIPKLEYVPSGEVKRLGKFSFFGGYQLK